MFKYIHWGVGNLKECGSRNANIFVSARYIRFSIKKMLSHGQLKMRFLPFVSRALCNAFSLESGTNELSIYMQGFRGIGA